MKNKIISLVMAGGKGTRFWPLSTNSSPKQYLTLSGENSLLTETLKRIAPLSGPAHRYVVTIEEQKQLAETHCAHELKNLQQILLEPAGRNTAPCILLSLAKLLSEGHQPQDILAIMPSDHVILNHQGFVDTVKSAAKFSHQTKCIVTIGITPHFPHTGFGYIEKGSLCEGEIFKVLKFKEKPHVEVAKEYVASGKFLWNAGMLVAPIQVFLDEFKKCSPEIFNNFEALLEYFKNPSGRNLKLIYELIPSDSFDYAVLEKSNSVYVIPAMFDWNDLGSWDALSSVIPEEKGNTIVRSDGTYFLNSHHNVIYAPDKFVSLIDMNEHMIVMSENAILVAPIESAQKVKNIVEHLSKFRPELT